MKAGSIPQKEEGAIGREKLVVKAGAVSQCTVSSTDHRFTMLPFASASGEAVHCVIIFQNESGQVPAPWHTGYGKEVELVRDADDKSFVKDILGKNVPRQSEMYL